MQLGATAVTAASISTHPSFGSRLLRTPSQLSRFSPLISSSSRPRPAAAHFSTSTLKTHLSNLEKLLQSSDVDDQPSAAAAAAAAAAPKQGSGVFHGLNLAGIWPGDRKVEEMSPRHFNKLKRLLSRRADYSPRNSIAARWLDYHGYRDWAGLLDPLDENLRREIVRYGEFVQGAYHTFHSNPSTPAAAAAAAPPERLVSVPDRAFRVTKNLYATSSVRLPEWVEEAAPAWMTQRSSWVGYVAVCDSPGEIARMGRRDIVIALRGTATCLEWAENARANLVGVAGAGGEEGEDVNRTHSRTRPMVECGFSSLYNTRGAHVQSLSEAIVDEVRRLVDEYKGEQLSITVTGHSLGAALAVLAADELSSIDGIPPIAVISFGGPRVGNRAFANRVTERGVKVLRIVNSRDVITRVPGLPVAEESYDTKQAWGYSHVGSELRLDSKASPFLKPDADVSCCHDLEAYLHLVDGFMGTDCPFRDNAKRPLWKLLNEQRSNMKKLYTNTAKDLAVNTDMVRLQAVGCLASPS